MICTKCNIDKDISNFHLNRGKSISKCKDCTREYYKSWYKKNGRKRAKNYLEVQTVWRKNNLEKASAKSSVGWALKIGKISRSKSCSLCGSTSKLVGHHIDYKDVLGIMWLCVSCHRRVHTGDIKLDVTT